MDYDTAEREFQRLEALRQTGQIAPDAYRAQLAALQVQDQWGRPWMLQEGSGQWFVLHQGQWMAATPPGRAPGAVQMPASFAPPMTMPPPSYAPPPPVAAEPVLGGESRSRGPAVVYQRRLGCAAITLRILLWDALWIGVGYLVHAFLGPRWLMAYIGVGVLALASLVWTVARISPRGATR